VKSTQSAAAARGEHVVVRGADGGGGRGGGVRGAQPDLDLELTTSA